MVIGDDPAFFCREAKDGEGLRGACIVIDISVGVTGEEIVCGDGVFGVFCAVDESSLDVCQSRDVVDGSELEGVGSCC